MASNHPPGRVLCRRKPHGQPQGETAQEEDTCGFGFNPRPSPATTATGHASLASALSAMSVPAGDVDDPLLNLRSRSHAMMMIGHVGKMSVYGYSDRRFKPRLHRYDVSSSKVLNPHCFSRLSCEISVRWEPPHEGILFSAMSSPMEIALKKQ